MEIYGVYMNRLLRTDEFERLMHFVSEERRAKVKKFVKPEDANRALIGEVLIRTVIRSKLHVRNDRIIFTANRYGKPSVLGMPSFHFNISHSGRWIVCAVDCQPVGIDVEEIKPVEYEIAKHFFSMKEYRFLMETEEPVRVSRFYDLWTLKESFVKLVGKGLALSPQSFSINVEADLSHAVRLANSEIPCFFKRLNVDPNYKMAVCSTTGVFPEQMILTKVDDLRMVSSFLIYVDLAARQTNGL